MTSTVRIGGKVLGFAALNKFDTLNAVVNRVSRGSINRDTLAQSILRDAIHLGTQYAIDHKLLGQRSAELVPLTRDALIDNDLARMKMAVGQLVSSPIAEVYSRDSAMVRAGKALLASAAGYATSTVGGALVGDHAAEKIVATHVKMHGWKPLEDYMRTALAGTVGGNFIAGQIKAILTRTMVKREFESLDSAVYRMFAGQVNEFLTGSGDYLKPLREYAPVLTTIGEAIAPYSGQLRDGVDNLAQKVLGQPKLVDAREVSEAEIQYARVHGRLPPAIRAGAVTKDTTDRAITATLLRERIVASELSRGVTSTETVQAEMDAAHRDERIDANRHAVVSKLVDMLSDAQLKPLGVRGGIDMAHTLTGQLDRVEAQSHFITDLPDDIAAAMCNALALAPTETTTLNGFVVGSGYAEHAGKLRLTLPKSDYGYADAAIEGGRAVVSYSRNLVGGLLGSDIVGDPAYQSSAELRQLYNTCGRSEEMLATVTRFLDPEFARAALSRATLQQMREPGSDLVMAGGAYLALRDPSAPELRFDVQRLSGMVAVSIEAIWKIDRYGETLNNLREPEGGKPSQLTSAVRITMKPDPMDGSPAIAYHQMGVLASVNNVLQFDLSTGALKQ
ncbi:hypothetical protein VL15_38845 [Burkholderia cepacia]|uniref:Uncharacterized protein n=1 Tax=Burkholderia cepacia TaxID=292 RepID=A0A0J5VII5_BURCE|nr:hypothetical protein [Burkholderia cepacia]KML37867.1 hypothetical protein VL15_38845 [Burkholderia cepacia]